MLLAPGIGVTPPEPSPSHGDDVLLTIDVATFADDAQSLRSALLAVGDWDGDVTPLVGPARPTAHRVRRQSYTAEYNALTTEIEQLQRELVRLQPSGETPDTLRHEWRRIARRQQKQRRTAAAANVMLRCVCVEQLRLAHQVDRVLSRANRSLHEAGGLYAAAVTNVPVYRGPTVDAAIHARYLDRLRGQADVVFSADHFQSKSGEDFRELLFRDLGADGLQVEFAVSWLLPFSVDAVAAAVWADGCREQGVTSGGVTKNTHTSSTLTVSSFTSLPRSHKHPLAGVGQGLFALQPLPKADDGSILMLSRIQMRSFDDDGKCAGLVHGDGYMRLEPVTRGTTATTRGVCRLSWARRVTARAPRHERVSPPDRAQWTQALISGGVRRQWDHVLESSVSAVENLLLKPAGTEEKVCSLQVFVGVGSGVTKKRSSPSSRPPQSC